MTRQTHGIVLIGKLGGSDEEDAAELLGAAGRANPSPRSSAGRHAPGQRRMGHAGAFTSGEAGAADRKDRGAGGGGRAHRRPRRRSRGGDAQGASVNVVLEPSISRHLR